MVIVTMRGEPYKRYMVDIADEGRFTTTDVERYQHWTFSFGAQAIRAKGVIDEQYRILSGTDITKVTIK